MGSVDVSFYWLVWRCVMSLVQQTHQYVGAPAGADRGAGQRVKGSAAVKVFTAQVVWTIAQSAAYGAALVPAIKKKTHTHTQSFKPWKHTGKCLNSLRSDRQMERNHTNINSRSSVQWEYTRKKKKKKRVRRSYWRTRQMWKLEGFTRFVWWTFIGFRNVSLFQCSYFRLYRTTEFLFSPHAMKIIWLLFFAFAKSHFLFQS